MTTDINIINDTTVVTVVDTPVVVDITNINEVVDITADNIIVEFGGENLTNVDLTIDEQTVNILSEDINVSFDGLGAQGNPGLGFIQVYRVEPDKPFTPTDGSFNFNTNILTPPVGWSLNAPALIANHKLWGTYTSIEKGKDIVWSPPFVLSTESSTVSGVTSFRAEPVPEPDIGLIWARKFTYSQNLRVGNSTNSTWLEIVPGLGTVMLSPIGTNTERTNYLKINANVNSTDNRNLVDRINSNNIGRKL